MKSFRISLRNVVKTVAVLAVIALSSNSAMAQTTFEYTDASGVRATYVENTTTRCPNGETCVNLESVISIPAGLKTWAMDEYVTYNNVTYSLKEMGSHILTSITSNGNNLITSVTELIFPNSMTLVDVGWQYYMPNIHKITFGKNMLDVGHNGGLPLDTVVFLGTKPTRNGVLIGSFDFNLPNLIAYIPCGTTAQFVASYNAYPNYWGNMSVSNFIEMPCLNTLTVLSSDVSKGDAYSFAGCGFVTTTPDNTSANHSGLITLLALARGGVVFTGWNDGNLENPRVVNVTADVTYTAQFATCTNTAIKSVSAQASGMSVYPNPVENLLTVVLERDVHEGTLALFDLNGKLAARQEMNGRQAVINTQSLGKGLYILRLVEGGNASEGVKIVKQ